MGLFTFRYSHRTLDSFDRIQDAFDQNAIPNADSTTRGIERAQVEERFDQMLLVCAAMWELLSERAGVTETDLVAKIAEIDARDGVADGKMTYTPVKCTKCERTIFPKQQRCLYCGADRPVDSVFKSI